MKKFILLAFALILQTISTQAMDGDDKGVIELGVLGGMHEKFDLDFGRSPIPFSPSNLEKPKKKLNKLPTIIEEHILLIQNGNEETIFVFQMFKGHPILGG